MWFGSRARVIQTLFCQRVAALSYAASTGVGFFSRNGVPSFCLSIAGHRPILRSGNGLCVDSFSLFLGSFPGLITSRKLSGPFFTADSPSLVRGRSTTSGRLV
jgi:hypothetical protein